MSEQPALIGVVTPNLGGYYIGAMISGIHQAARSAGVEVLIVQQALRDMRFPILGSRVKRQPWLLRLPSYRRR